MLNIYEYISHTINLVIHNNSVIDGIKYEFDMFCWNML